jgi:hypothetical protein
MTADIAPDYIDSLPIFTDFGDVADVSRYRALPENWLLAVADVVSSSEAIAQGKYKMVNMAGASVITAVLNTLGRMDYPFVFGGDGAVIAVPGWAEDQTRTALAAVARWISEDLGLTMRVAIVPLSAIRAEGLDVQVARFRTGPDLTFAMFAGGGSSWAEAQMKAGAYTIAPAEPGSRPDLTGLSCRWNPLAARNGNIVSVIAVPGTDATPESFRALVADLVAILNTAGSTGNPLPDEGPQPMLSFAGVEPEVRATAPRGKALRTRIAVMAQIILTYVLYWTRLSLGGFNARSYARQFVHNTDFRKFDDGLKMTVDVDAAGLSRIEAMLADAAARNLCDYGLHRQDSALVTCIVPSALSRDHMHFIDGASGGYAEAAVRMKAMVRQRGENRLKTTNDQV